MDLPKANKNERSKINPNENLKWLTKILTSRPLKT
jgi:hypothetical protein